MLRQFTTRHITIRHTFNRGKDNPLRGLSSLGMLITFAIILGLFYFINKGLLNHQPPTKTDPVTPQKISPSQISHGAGSQSSTPYVSAYHKGMQGAQKVVDVSNERYGKK